MTDLPPQPARPVRKVAARAARAGTSLVWLVPFLALALTLGLAWQSYSGRGELISVEFRDATGISPGETRLKFREISVGKVESVRFSEDLSHVLVDIRVDQDIAPYIDADAEFWVVRPQVTAQGISRLDTVLSGVFIEGFWDSERDEQVTHFVGADKPPLAKDDANGTWVVLFADEAAGLAEGAPIMYRGVPVGRMQNLRLAPGGDRVMVDVFVESPHDARLTSASAFWNVSGFSVSLGAQGVKLGIDSLSTLIQGGVEFATLSSGGQPISRGHSFRLHPDEEAARRNLIDANAEEIYLSMLIDPDQRGLEKNAEVRYHGLAIGRVTEIGVDIDETRPEVDRVKQRITLALSPSRLTMEQAPTSKEAMAYLNDQIAKGLRARLSSAGFLGTSLIIELVDIPDAEPAPFDMAATPFPVIPSVPGDLTDFETSARGLLTRIGDLPFEDLMRSATEMMRSVTDIAASDDTRALPNALRSAIDDAGQTMTDLRGLAGDLRDTEAATKLSALLEEGAAAAAALKLAADEAPAMIDKIDAAASAVDEFDFADISAEAKSILTDLRAMLGSKDAEQLPRNLSDTLQAASGLLNDLRDGNASGNLNDALKSAKLAAESVSSSVQSLPALSTRFQQLASRAESVVAAYGERGALNAEARSALRDISRAATAFSSLARTIERNPQAFILGR